MKWFREQKALSKVICLGFLIVSSFDSKAE